MAGFQSCTQAMACALSCIMLAGCATTGIRDVDDIRHGIPVTITARSSKGSFDLVCSTNPSATLVEARNCVQSIATSLSETQLGFYDQANEWNYAFTAVAGGVVGTTIFGAAPDAVKALALGGGSLAALNSIQPPIALSATYGSGAVALQCVVDASNGIPADVVWQQNAKDIAKHKESGDGDLALANTYVAAHPTDAEIATLKAAIDTYGQAQQLYTSVIPFLSSPPATLLGQIETVRMRIIQKLAPNSTSAASQETAINTYIAAMQSSASGGAAKSDANGNSQAITAKLAGYQATATIVVQMKLTMRTNLAAAGIIGDRAQHELDQVPQAPPPPPSLALASTLNADAKNILGAGQKYSDIQTQITGCIAKMP